MMTKSEHLTISANEQLKHAFKLNRDSVVRAGANLQSFQRYVAINEEEYDCPEGMEVIRNTWYGRKSDYKLTRLIENYLLTLES